MPLRAEIVVALLLTACPGRRVPGPAVESHATPSGELAPAVEAVLVDAAEDLEVGVRGPALDALIRSSAEPAAGAWGQRGVHDPSPWVQRRVVDALEARLPEEETADLLGTLAERQTVDVYVRARASAALLRAGDDRALDSMKACATDEPAWRGAPCALVAAQSGDLAAQEQLRAAIVEAELPLDLDFIDALGRSGLTQLAPTLVAALQQVEEPLVAPLAVAALHLDPGLGAPPVRALLSDDDLVVRLEVLDFLAKTRSSAALEQIGRARAGKDVDADYASLILVSWGEEAPTVALARADSTDSEVRAWVCWALAEGWSADWDNRHRRDARDLLVRSLDDTSGSVQFAAIRALGRIPGPVEEAEAAALSLLLQADTLEIRVEAARALIR